MKKITYFYYRHIAGLMLCMFLFASCEFNEPGTQPVNISFKILPPTGITEGFSYDKMTVTLAKNGKTVYQIQANSNGVAIFEGIIPDVYNVSTSAVITSEEYEAMLGKPVQYGKYVISGSLLEEIIATDGERTLSTAIARKQELIISKIYYAGSKDFNNKNYLAGRYIEFFNNSEEAINIAGTYFGLLESESTPAYMLGDTPDYLYLKQIFRFPNTGKTTLEPGEAVIVVNSAIDHTVAAAREADLTTADFEAKDNKNTNNPDVPAIELIYTAYATIPSMNLSQGGPCSVVLFTTDEDVNTWERVYKKGASKGTRFVKMPIKYVTDGVECLKFSATGVDTGKKRLYDYIDGSYINIGAASGYNGQVVYRRMEESSENSSTPTLIDTNHSSSDFGVSDQIMPKQFLK